MTEPVLRKSLRRTAPKTWGFSDQPRATVVFSYFLSAVDGLSVVQR